LNEAAGAAVEKAVAAFASCLRGSRVFAAQPFRQEVFQWLRSALFAAA